LHSSSDDSTLTPGPFWLQAVPPFAGSGWAFRAGFTHRLQCHQTFAGLHGVRGEPFRVVISDTAERSRFPTPGDGGAPAGSRFGAMTKVPQYAGKVVQFGRWGCEFMAATRPEMMVRSNPGPISDRAVDV